MTEMKSTSPWYHAPLRIAALQCNFEHAPLAVPEKWQQMGFNTEQLLHVIGEGYWGYFRIEEHGEMLRQYLDEAHRRGLKIILYLNVHMLNLDQDGGSDWIQRDPAGEPHVLYGSFQAVCLNSPWREVFSQTLRDLAEYDIDGVFLDGPVIRRGGCFCRHCKQRFQEEFARPLDGAEDTWEFYRRTRDDFLNEGYRLFKEAKPDAPYYMNLPVTHLQGSYTRLPDALAYNDIVGTEGGFLFYGPPNQHYPFKTSLAAKLLEAVAPDKPRVIFMAADQKAWAHYIHEPLESMLCVMASAANGANIWWGLHGPTPLLDHPGARAAGECIRFLARHEACYDQSESLANVGVLYSLDTQANYTLAAEASDLYGTAEATRNHVGNFTQSVQGIADILIRGGIPFDLLTECCLSPEHLRRYEMLLLPTCACLSDATVELLREYVRQGGTLWATFDTSLYDDTGRPRDDFALADVFGASCTGPLMTMNTWNYFTPTARSDLFEKIPVPLLQAPSHALGTTTAEEAKVLARFLTPQPGPYVPLGEPDRPALIEHEYGQGRCFYFSGTFGEMAFAFTPPTYRDLLLSAVLSSATPPVRIENTPGNIELTVRQVRGEMLMHLLNHNGVAPRPYRNVMPQENLTLRVASGGVRSARALRANLDCETWQDGDDTLIRLPRLDEFEVLRLKQ